MNKWILFVVLIIAIPGCGVGCLGVAAVAVSVIGGGSGEAAKPATEDSFWSALADDVATYKNGYPDTEVLLKTADGAVKRGVVKDMSRLDSLKRNEVIDDSNRDAIIRTVRGGGK